MKMPLLISGITYLIAGVLTLCCGVSQFGHDAVLALKGQLNAENARGILVLTLLFTALTVFFIATGLAIFVRRWRRFVIVGAAISCVLVPIGTVPGLVFMLWARRHWPPTPAAQPKAQP